MPDPAREIVSWLPFPSTVDVPLEEEIVALFDSLQAPLLRYVLSFGLEPHDGEDIVQEAFLALFRHLRKGKRRDNIRGWIFRVGHNLALKRRARLSRTELSDRADPRPNPEQQLEEKRRHEKLWAVVAALPERDRHCLNLRAEGLTYREIADVLDISLGGVAASVGRSLAKLTVVNEG